MRLKMLRATKVKLTLFIPKTMFHQPQDCDFYSLDVSQHKAGTLNRWSGKLNHLLMDYLLSNNCIKNYMNVTTTVKITIGAWVVYFFLQHNVRSFLFYFYSHFNKKHTEHPYSIFLWQHYVLRPPNKYNGKQVTTGKTTMNIFIKQQMERSHKAPDHIISSETINDNYIVCSIKQQANWKAWTKTNQQSINTNYKLMAS